MEESKPVKGFTKSQELQEKVKELETIIIALEKRIAYIEYHSHPPRLYK